MRKLIAFSAVLATIMTIGVAIADESDLEKLTNQWWGYCRDKNFDALENMLAPGFLGGNQNTTYGQKGFMELVRKVNLSDFKLSDFKVSRKDNVAAVSYYCQVAETIGGKHIQKQKAPRLDVWIKTGKGWKVFTHANLNPLGK